MKPLVLVTPNTRTIPDCPGADYAGVDAGLIKLAEAGITPVFACGDFDSVQGPLPQICPILKHPAEKDEPDSQLAVEEAVRRGYDPVILTGALSGRIDHTIAAIRMLGTYGQLELMDEGQRVTLLGPGTWKTGADWRHISVFAAQPACITLSGMKYLLERRSIVPSDIYTLSNEAVSEDAAVTVHSGRVLLVQSDLP